MFTSSLRMCKKVVDHMSIKLIKKNGTIMIKNSTVELRWNSKVPSQLSMGKKFNDGEEDIGMIVKLLIEYPSSECICWNEMHKKLQIINVPSEDYRSVIFRACLKLGNLDAGISYYNYLINRGEELTILELVFFIKLFTCRKDQISKHENLIKQLYENVKQYMQSSSVLQEYLIELIAEIPSCFYDFVKDNKHSISGKRILAKKAFELKNAELGYQIMNSGDIKIKEFFRNYVKYLCEMVKENKFSPDMITTFIKFCEGKNSVIDSKSFLPLIIELVDILKKHDKDYIWTLRKCSLSDSGVCSKCSTKLVEKLISETDFNFLKETFLADAGLIKKNVFLSTSDKELQKFLEFLRNSKPFDIVFDGLNIIYKSRNCATGDLSRFLKYFLDKGFRVLIIARIHARKEITQIRFLKKRNYINNCQFFFTENLSDDDVFVLYAALHGGRGTYLISGDLLQRYGARFNDQLKKIFFKWKLYHQYITKGSKLYPPRPHLGLPQLTVEENGKIYIWHISHSEEDVEENRLNSFIPLQWICLKAEKKADGCKKLGVTQ